jgi:heparosan-N-sulfate-glucuronate 5-epimerase
MKSIIILSGALFLLTSLAISLYYFDISYSLSSTKQIKSSNTLLSNFSDVNVHTVKNDTSGIPVLDYGYINGTYIGPQRNPLNISSAVVAYYHLLKNNPSDSKSKQLLINNANWLVDNAVSHGNYSILEYNFPFPPYNLKAPWQSGMAQGVAIQAMLRAHEITQDKKYIDTAKMLLNSFYVEAKNGGVTYKTPAEGWWYEEYAGSGGKQPRVLNGMMFALIGILDYYQYTKDESAKYLFEQGVLSLKNNLAHYDYGGYTYYDSLGNVSPVLYHNDHITLLEQLYNATGEKIFQEYYYKWKSFKIPENVKHL